MNQGDDSTTKGARPAPFAHLFVAIDFSTGAEAALSRAARLPIAESGKITVAHVLSDAIPKRMRAEAERVARRNLRDAAKSVIATPAMLGRRDIKITTELCHGLPYVEIIRRARSVAADLVVIGRHGRRPIRDMFIGSTAERVIRAGDLPLLVVSRQASRPYRRPLFAVDLGDTSRSVVRVALRALGPEAATATLLHVWHDPYESFITPTVSPVGTTGLRKAYRDIAAAGLEELRASIGNLGVQWRTVLVRGDARGAILKEAARYHADVLTVGTHGRSGIAHALVGSVAEWVIRAAGCDVLVARPVRVSFELP